MALPPDSNETFLREVDENLRRDRVQDFFKAYGKWLAIGVVVFLAVVGGWIYRDNRLQRQSAEQSEQLHSIFSDIAAGKANSAAARLPALEKADNDIVRAAAVLTQAAVALEKNDRATAITKYRALANQDDVPQAYRDLASIRLTALEFDTLKPEDVIARMKPLAQAGNPWFGSAGELTGLAYVKQGRKAEAGRMFAAMAADKQVPNSIRSRAVQIAGTLGVDASASLPAIEQQDQ